MNEVDMDEEDTPWKSLFTSCTNAYHGWVPDLETAKMLIAEFSYSSSTSYTITRTTKNFGNLDATTMNHFVRFEDDGMTHSSKNCSPIELNGTPFFLLGNRLMECHQGPQRRKAGNKMSEGDDHTYMQQSTSSRSMGSKKLGCAAAVYLREVVCFPQYKLQIDTPHFRRMQSELLKTELLSAIVDEIHLEKRIYIDLPPLENHDGSHIMGNAADLKAPIDQRVVDFIYSLVDDGVNCINELKRHVYIFVRDLFSKHNLPKAINRRFFPSRDDLRKMIDRRRRKNRDGLMDQECLNEKIISWQEQHPDDFWKLRSSTSANVRVPEPGDKVAELSVFNTADQSFLLVYQSAWQKRMLSLYGKETVFLDATYRTTKYALPLFFLCVNSNTGYIVVGMFVVEKEDSASVSEALSCIRDNNPNWSTKSFMIDSSEIEMIAINNVFPEATIFICDFHRKQAWNRWTSAWKNGVNDKKDEIVAKLNPPRFWKSQINTKYLKEFFVRECLSCGVRFKEEHGFFGGRGIHGECLGFYDELSHPGYCSYMCYQWDNIYSNND